MYQYDWTKTAVPVSQWDMDMLWQKEKEMSDAFQQLADLSFCVAETRHRYWKAMAAEINELRDRVDKLEKRSPCSHDD